MNGQAQRWPRRRPLTPICFDHIARSGARDVAHARVIPVHHVDGYGLTGMANKGKGTSVAKAKAKKTGSECDSDASDYGWPDSDISDYTSGKECDTNGEGTLGPGRARESKKEKEEGNRFAT